MNTETLKTYIEERREAMISDLRGLVEIPSVTENREQVKRALSYVLDLGREMGFTVETAAAGSVGVISFGEGDETVGILAHVDVVPPGDLTKWMSAPFSLVERDGRLYGRGALDDKGAVIAALYAMKAVKDSGMPIRKRVQLILGTQEETEWSDMEVYVRENELPDYGFAPDGTFPVCNIEKGAIDLLLRFPLDEAVHADGWYLSGLQAGTALNMVPGECRAVLKAYRGGRIVSQREVKVSGRSVHSCQPEKGVNAIFVMAQKLEEEALQSNRLYTILLWLSEKLGDVYGAGAGIYSETEYYNGEFVHRNVLAPTLVSVEDDVLLVNVNIRFAYGNPPERIIEAFRSRIEELGAELEVVSRLPAVYVAKDRPFIRAFSEAYEQGSGRKNEFALEYGGTYAKAMPNIVSWGPLFPGDEDTCHEVNEYIKTETLIDNGNVFAAALAKIALSEESFK